jgi:DNA mismatch repair protein MutL
MGKIIRLDEVTINQIAAGEVVERPASVVKELVENSIDAGAKKIEIHLVNGGRQKIQVIDDGAGMEREDALLAVERHATSKIHTFQDLQQSRSLGFRGEALASIAAVSRMVLQTCPDPGALGVKIQVEAGIVRAVEPVGAPRGTNISVENLFSNTPARLKFMRSIPSEVSNVKEMVTSMALGYPEISFRLFHQDMELVHTLGSGDYEQTLEQIFNRSICQEIFPVEGAYGPMHVTGFLGRPNIARGNRGLQYFFLNRRLFRSRLIAAAAEKAYDTLLPVARFPFLLLNIELPLELVDVNVHPTKMEVKFREEKEIFRGILQIVRSALATNVTATMWRPQYKPNALSSLPPPVQGSILPTVPAWEEATSLETGAGAGVASLKEDTPSFAGTGVLKGPLPASLEVLSEVRLNEKANKGEQESEKETDPADSFQGTPEVDCHPVGTLFDTYLLWEDGSALVLVDQHAAHERILYDRYRSGSRPKMQYFLTPLTLELTAAQWDLVNEEGALLRELGWDFEAFGGGTLILRSGLQDFSVTEVEELFLSLLNELAGSSTGREEDPADRLLKIMACRRAIKAGDRLSPQEAAVLLRDLRRAKVPQTCPHGRPTMVAITKAELEKMFQRR